MDPTSIVDDTEPTRFCPQTYRRTDGEVAVIFEVWFSNSICRIVAWVLNVKSPSGDYHYSAKLFHTRSNPGRSLTSGLHRLHSQYHVCWCSSNFRSQGISSHVTDPQSQNIPSPASKGLRSLHHLPGANELMPCGLMDSEGSQYQDAILPVEGFPL